MPAASSFVVFKILFHSFIASSFVAWIQSVVGFSDDGRFSGFVSWIWGVAAVGVGAPRTVVVLAGAVDDWCS